MAKAKGIVRGDREIRANMRRIQNALGGAALKSDAFEALQPMKEQTEDNARAHRQPFAPRGGHLDQNVTIVKHRSRGPLFIEVWLTFKGRGRKIAHLLEYGTAPHWQPNRGIMHPGARAFPFVRPAFEEHKDDAGMIMGRLAWRRISTSLIGTPRR